MTIKALVLTVFVLTGIGIIAISARPAFRGVRTGKADQDYVQSKNCIHCHDRHYQSWARTYHSRMTQEARPGTVQGDFEKANTLDYLGVSARMERHDGRFYMTLRLPEGKTESYQIERTVGSRRIEQYLTRQAGEYTRLPVAYDLINRRWMNLNGSFFYPDGDNYNEHRSQWNINCVFCHNVKAQPYMDRASRSFDTEVNELGIACGACHGASAEHAELAASPFTRTWWRIVGAQPRQIIQPEKLTPERSLMICGHCHGQRIPEPPDRIEELLTRGDPYNAGDDLSRYYRPVWRETKIGDYSFANRFWPNGSPRLTAYEYQGILRSRCFTEGSGEKRINCLTCHSMHSGDPKGQITDENRTNKPCLQCHQQYAATDALIAHTGHKSDSTGSGCYNCHMPRVVYGVMSVHPTHDITIPDARLTVVKAVPNACNQCHLDRSVNWSIKESQQLWPRYFAGSRQSNDQQFDLPEGARALFAGDALTRALAAEALGGGGPAQPDPGWSGPLLTEALSDNYPIVRFFAANGLARGGWRLSKPDYLADVAARERAVTIWREQFGAERWRPWATLAQGLRARRIDVDIEVGE